MLPKLLTLRMTYQVMSIGSVLAPPRRPVPKSGRVSSETGSGDVGDSPHTRKELEHVA